MHLSNKRLGMIFLEVIFNGFFVLSYFLLKSDFFPLPVGITSLLGSYVDFFKYLAPVIVFLSMLQVFLTYKSIGDFFRYHIFSIIIFVPMLISYGDAQFTGIFTLAHLVSTFLNIRGEVKGGEKVKDYDAWEWLTQLKLTPAQVLIVSFLLVILVGTFFLATPFAWEKGKGVTIVEALFTATSATCVTGLSVVSLSDNFNIFGELVTLLLIQIGGLGLMTLSSSMMIILGRKFGVKGKGFMQDILDSEDFEGILGLITDIIKYTFIIEMLGAVVLTLAFTYEGIEFSRAFYYGVFHSISAFCNAGFSLFNDSLEGFRDNWVINWTIMLLIIFGGLGFIVLKELKIKIFDKKSLKNFTLHSKIVLMTNLILISGGALYFYFSEFLHLIDGLPFWSQVHASLFQSVTTRTAGFNTVPLGNLQMSTILVMMILMFIGASPGSTGGGIKTTTMAILFRSILTILNGERDVEFFRRRIPSGLVIKAIALVIVSLTTVLITLLFLIQVDSGHSFMELLFEVISAFATVGLSLGMTGDLGVWGKLLITILMFIGRVGPLTLVLAVGESAETSNRREYPEGRVLIG